MRFSVDHLYEAVLPVTAATRSTMARSAAPADPAAPDVTFLTDDPAAALRSFFATVERVVAANPCDTARLVELAGRARASAIDPSEQAELRALMLQATRQGRAMGAVIGFFLKFTPYPMLEEVRQRAPIFQPAFGPVLVVDGPTVREVLERHDEFTVEPYGTEMQKAMSPQYNGGFDTFILSTDDTAAYDPDRHLLSAVCTRADAAAITDLVHRDCRRRIAAAVDEARQAGSSTLDVVQAVARYVPVTLGHRYLGVPVAARMGSFELTPEMLTYYGTPIDGVAETALAPGDGVIPDEHEMYLWIKAAFRHFFNNVQKDPVVQVEGLRSCRQLLAYLLREVAIQRQRLQDGDPVDDTMLTRLLRLQLGESVPGVERPADLDPRRISDLRIAENVMGTIVGAVAGQEEATCRVVDTLMRLGEGEYRTTGPEPARCGTFADATALARDILRGSNVEEIRARLYAYVLEALRLQPQGEILLRKCVRDGATIAGSRPMSAGTFVFAAHGSAMQDVPEPDAFILDRPREHHLPYGWGRHTCLGQHVSPVIIVETLATLLGLQDLTRPAARPGEASFPFERRFGRLQLDDQNLYATSFSLQFTDAGTTREFWPPAAGTVSEKT